MLDLINRNREAIQNMNDDFFKDEAPISGGNTRQTYIDLNVQIQKDLTNMNQIHKKLNDDIANNFADATYEEWRLLNFQADYFCNVWPVITDSHDWNEKIQLAKRLAFLYGKSGIMRDPYTDKFIVVYIKNLEISYTGTILSAAVASGQNVLSTNVVKPNPAHGWNLTGERLSPENFALFQWDTTGWGAWYKFWPFIIQQKRLLQILGTDAYSYIKKFTYKVKDPTASNEEVKTYFNPANPFLVVSDLDEDYGNRFQTLDVKNAPASNTLLDYYKFWENTYYNLIGRRQNSDAKRERNITSEVDASQSNFDVLENDNYIHTISFLTKLERMSGLKFRLAKNEIEGEKIDEVENDI